MLQNSPDRSPNTEVAVFALPGWPGWSANMWQPMLNAMVAWNCKFGPTVAAFNAEWLDFVNRRIKEDFALSQRIGACKSPDQAWRTYSEFLLKATDDYQNEFAELVRLASWASAEGAAVMQAGTKGAGREKDRVSMNV